MYLCFIYSNAICIKEPLNNDPQSKWYFNSKYHKDQRKLKSNSELFNKGQWEVDREKKDQMIGIFNNVLIRKVNQSWFPTVFEKGKTFQLKIPW